MGQAGRVGERKERNKEREKRAEHDRHTVSGTPRVCAGTIPVLIVRKCRSRRRLRAIGLTTGLLVASPHTNQ